MPSRKYPQSFYTWGVELEVGDVRREVSVPEKYGRWEYSETDVVNTLPPYRHVACDPLGESPPVGGEINTVPTTTRTGQAELVADLLRWLWNTAGTPTTNCISHTHVHLGVPGLTQDSAALRRLTAYIADNQEEAIRAVHAFDASALGGCRAGAAYLKWDCGRPMPTWMSSNIAARCTDFKSFIRLQCCGKDGISMGRPLRYAVNTYCLKHTGTIEFRLFRGSVNAGEIGECLRFAGDFMDAALNAGPSVAKLLSRGYALPKFRYCREEAKGWLATKWPTSRGKKERRRVQPSACY